MGFKNKTEGKKEGRKQKGQKVAEQNQRIKKYKKEQQVKKKCNLEWMYVRGQVTDNPVRGSEQDRTGQHEDHAAQVRGQVVKTRRS